MNAKTFAALCLNALGLSLLPVLFLVLVSIAYGKPNCELPVPARPSMFGYKAAIDDDQLGQRWTYLTIFFDYGEVELTRQLDRFPPDSLKKAQAEGNKWMKCVNKLLKVRPKPLLLVRHE